MGKNITEIIGLILLGFFIAIVTMGYLGYKYYVQIEGQLSKNYSIIENNIASTISVQELLMHPIKNCQETGPADIYNNLPILCYVTPTPRLVNHPCIVNVPGQVVGAGVCTF